MIIRSQRLIFVHIPKTGGTSIEYALLGKDCDFDRADYEHLWGWCPDRRIWMQHASPQQLVDLELLDRSDFENCFVFGIVRNPFDRAVSAYHYLRRARGGFGAMLERSGPWRSRLADATSARYVGDHLRPQSDYTMIDGVPVLDHVGRFERIAETWTVVERHLDSVPDLPHSNVGASRFAHYSHFYSDREVAAVAALYACDLERFDYRFDDRRTTMTRLRRPAARSRLALGRMRESLEYRVSRLR